MAWITRRQGYLFFPLLLLEGLNLHLRSFQDLFARRKVEGRWVELGLLGARFACYLGVVFWLLPLGMAFAFLGVQLAVFGLYMGASFAPNHVGMPIVPRNAKLDFLNKQVRTARNVYGGWWMTALMGGLNYQIEHHLFPSIPRPRLADARPRLADARKLVRKHCQTLDVPYTETSLIKAWAIVIAYLNCVGLAARNSFQCPSPDDYSERSTNEEVVDSHRSPISLTGV
jgi:fatty acid desaturase